MIETLEVLQRTWHVDGQSVRPDHRMVAHTGFLTHARLLAPDARVNFLDLVVVAVAAGGRLGRVPVGLRAAGTSWAGLAVGLVVGVLLVPTSPTRSGRRRRARGCSRRWRSSCWSPTVAQAVGAAIGGSLLDRASGATPARCVRVTGSPAPRSASSACSC